MPIDADTATSRLPIEYGSLKVASIRVATCAALCSSASPSSSIRNSSPPTRAIVSAERDRPAQALADLAQHRVAAAVAERVVDRLEAVEVDEQHREARLDLVDAADGSEQLVLEDEPVRQLGQRVVVGDLLQIGIGLAQRLFEAVGAIDEVALDARHEARHRERQDRRDAGQQRACVVGRPPSVGAAPTRPRR
jgi:hypothetical protein